MKKILFGSVAAMISVVGFSSFKPVTRQTTYSFQVNQGLNIPKGTGVFTNGQVTATVNIVGGPLACVGSSHDCIVTFTASKLNTAHTQLKTGSQAGTTVTTRLN